MERFAERSGVIGKDFLKDGMPDEADTGPGLNIFFANKHASVERPFTHACQLGRATDEIRPARRAVSGRGVAGVLLQGSDADEFWTELLADRVRVFVLERGKAGHHA